MKRAPTLARGATFLVLGALASAACRKRDPLPPPPPEPVPFPSAGASAPLPDVRTREPEGPLPEPRARELIIDRVPTCEVEHHGRLLDLGVEGTSPWTGFRFLAPGPDDLVVRDGKTYLEASSRSLAYALWLNRPLERLRVTLRGRAGSARRVQVSVDGRRLGVVRLPEGEPKSFDLPELSSELEAGLHRFEVQFGGAPRASRGSHAELDWLRVSGASDRAGDEGYAAPTLSDIVENVALGNVPRRALVLRAPTTVRCFVRPVAGTALRVGLGLWGTGRGAAEIVARREGGEPVTLESRKVAGGDSSAWSPLDVDLSRFAGEPIMLELKAVEASRGGRIAFGEPELVQRDVAPPRVAKASVVVLVVFSAVEQARVPPWGPTGGLGSLGVMAREGAAFSRYRAPSSAPGSVLATLLTGLRPRLHSVEAPMLRLPATLRTLPRLVKEANGTAAFFTSVPTSFAPFGFDASWDAFEAFSPVKDLGANEPFARATSWLTHELDERPLARHLVVIHARGAHPPWDVTREEAQHLKPLEYNGAIEPRRAGVILGALRGRISGKKLRDDDWTRLHELTDLALAKQDAGLGQLLAVLRQKNVWDNALVVVMGDVGPGVGSELPYDPAGPLSEDRLAVPLLVKLPGRLLAGQDVHAPVTAADVATTLARGLGVAAAESGATDLLERSATGADIESPAQIATMPGRYTTRIGAWLLRGELGTTPRLCALDVDPACAVDVFEERSIAARTAWLATAEAERRRVPADLGTAARTPVELDPETRAALVVWGDIPP
jgi:sulfatase-like protein